MGNHYLNCDYLYRRSFFNLLKESQYEYGSLWCYRMETMEDPINDAFDYYLFCIIYRKNHSIGSIIKNTMVTHSISFILSDLLLDVAYFLQRYHRYPQWIDHTLE